MAIFHSSIQVISRGKGKSCIAAAAYRAGEKLYDERQEISQDYTKKKSVESEIIAPNNSPEWVYNRQKLWNEVDRAETRCNSRTAREINIALPVELTKDIQKEIARKYVKENFVDKGMVADLCFHFNDSNNPHFHVMLTTREINENGFTKKNRNWDKKENATIWRKNWAEYANESLKKAGFKETIDHRSYKDQGIDKLPTIHLGKTSNEMMKKNIENPRVEINKRIRELNHQKVVLLSEYRELKAKLDKEKEKENARYRYLTLNEIDNLRKIEKKLGDNIDLQKLYEYSSKITRAQDKNTNDLNSIRDKINSSKETIKRIDSSISDNKKLNEELSELPKKFFGGYKEKYAAEDLNRQIRYNNSVLERVGYEPGLTEKLNKEIEELKIREPKLELEITEENNKLNFLNIGIEIFRKQKLKDFQNKYINELPEIINLDYYGMVEIKNLQNKLNITGVKNIEIKYNEKSKELNLVNSEIKFIDNRAEKLNQAKEALKTIEETEYAAKKYDNVIFRREKYQLEHHNDKVNYDEASATLKKLGIKDKWELRDEIEQFNESSKNKEKLIKDGASITNYLKEFDTAKYYIDGAKRSYELDKKLKLKAQYRSINHKKHINKGFDFER